MMGQHWGELPPDRIERKQQIQVGLFGKLAQRPRRFTGRNVECAHGFCCRAVCRRKQKTSREENKGSAGRGNGREGSSIAPVDMRGGSSIEMSFDERAPQKLYASREYL
jgi:hypothetical protein